MPEVLLQDRRLVATEKQEVSYCIPLWLRDEQIHRSISRVQGRLVASQSIRHEPIAIVGYGPSLNETWEQLRQFEFIITCSGAHRFLIDRGIVPNWHVEVDPREHKALLIGQPNAGVEYMMASTCHPKVFDHLAGFNVKLWHIFDSAEEGLRVLPPGEWALTGGCGAGLRAMVVARCLGFVNQHIFGMDGNQRDDVGKHAGPHPSQAKKAFVTSYGGRDWLTTPAFLEAARSTFDELNRMPDVTATFYGDGLVQTMARDYVRTPVALKMNIAYAKPELISTELRDLNAKLHEDNLAYGVGGGKHADVVLKMVEQLDLRSVLDYGCGKGYLAKALPFPIWEYDPAVPTKAVSPRPADLVTCTDVLEHVEPDKLNFVLGDLRRCVKRVGYFVIHLGPAVKTYADGRNTHLIQRDKAWWSRQLRRYFEVGSTSGSEHELRVVVAPKQNCALTFGTLTFQKDPYVIGCATGVMDSTFYAQLVATFPPIELFRAFTGGDVKYSLSERNNAEAYLQFVKSHEPWRVFHDYVKSTEFVEKIGRVLNAHRLTIDLKNVSSRFEFSALPYDGGYLRPHRDLATKVATLVLSMVAPDDAGTTFEGGTNVLRPRRDGLEDYRAADDDFVLAHRFEQRSNQAVVFLRSDASWHSVGPLKGGEGYRRSVTINLERAS